MSRTSSKIFVVTAVFLAIALSYIGVLYLIDLAKNPLTDQLAPTIVERLDAYIRYQMEDKDIPSLSIAVVDDQQIVWSQGYGLSNPETNTPVTEETVYRVASISKLFTALSVMQLVEQRKVDLDAPVSNYLPGFNPTNTFEKPITLRQIHAHRSGLVREPPVGHYFDPTEPTLKATVESLNQTTLIYEPETRTKYSNAAVSVAGRVVEEVTEASFESHLQDAVIDPLGLSKTSFSPRSDLRQELGTGYMWSYDGKPFEAPVFELGMIPAANLYSTVGDLGRFISALFAIKDGKTDGIVQPATLDSMWQIQYATPGQTNGFGLGFYVSEFEGQKRVQHSGVMYGYATRVYAMPENNIGLAVVGNVDAVNAVVDRIGNYALSLLLAQKTGESLPGFTRATSVEPEAALALEGQYEGPRTIHLTERDGDLLVNDGTTIQRLRMVDNSLITDDRLGNGYRIIPHGDSLLANEGKYVKTATPIPMPVSAQLKDYLGEYGWDHNILYVLEREGQLYALIEWFFYYPLRSLGNDVFAFPDDGLYQGETLTFSRDRSGRISNASLEGVVFERRRVGPEEGDVFQITPVRPVEEIRSAAYNAAPPVEEGDFREPELVEITSLEPGIQLDIRYATSNNFMGVPFYTQARAFLQRPAAEALARAHQSLEAEGLGIIVYDGYRPWQVTKMFWDATPDSLRIFVANPANGSRHNRGCAVDIGLYDLNTGMPVEMPSGYDEFTSRAFPHYPGGTSISRYHRELLRDAMEEEGFSVYEAEWWHFDYNDWREYPLMNDEFSAIGE